MRISDWSSDVCSSDLLAKAGLLARRNLRRGKRGERGRSDHRLQICCGMIGIAIFRGDHLALLAHPDAALHRARRARKRVVSGKSVLERVYLGGRRIIKKKTDNDNQLHTISTSQEYVTDT